MDMFTLFSGMSYEQLSALDVMIRSIAKEDGASVYSMIGALEFHLDEKKNEEVL